MTDRPDYVAAIKAKVGLADYIGRFVQLKKHGREWVGLCPFHNEATGSFTVNVEKDFFHCFGCGAHGDIFEFVQRQARCDFNEAMVVLKSEAGITDAAEAREHARRYRRTARPPVDPARNDKTRQAQELWQSGQTAWAGSPVETYLRHRGLRFTSDPCAGGSLAWPASLRWLPACRYFENDSPYNGTDWPALLGAMQRYDRRNGQWRLVAVHRTYLKPDGSGKAPMPTPKKILGAFGGSVIRLAPASDRVGLAEGIETALSVMLAAPGLPVWVAGSLGNLAGRGSGKGAPHPDRQGQHLPSAEPDTLAPGVELPPGIRDVVLLADNDGKDPPAGEALIERAARRFTLEGRRVTVHLPPRGMDFNDVLMGKAG